MSDDAVDSEQGQLEILKESGKKKKKKTQKRSTTSPIYSAFKVLGGGKYECTLEPEVVIQAHPHHKVVQASRTSKTVPASSLVSFTPMRLC